MNKTITISYDYEGIPTNTTVVGEDVISTGSTTHCTTYDIEGVCVNPTDDSTDQLTFLFGL